MTAIHEIQWATANAVLALHIPEPHCHAPVREPIPSLRNLAYWLLPFGMVTAAALLIVEARSENNLSHVTVTYEESQRLDIAATEAMLIAPGAMALPAIEAPTVMHAAAPDEDSVEWSLTPPPVPEYEPMHSAAPATPHGERGVFLTPSSAGDDEFLEETMNQVSKFSHPALVIDVKGSFVYFTSGAPMATEMKLVRPLYDLPAIIAKAHERGITVIGRFIALKDPSLASRKSETQIRHPLKVRSVGNVWVDGENATTLQYNREILEELVLSGIDEINLDYIRYPTEYAQKDIGLTGAQRAEHIGTFIRMARNVIDLSGRPVRLGISTYAILGWNFPVNFESVGQDIPELAKIVDVISPMAYPSTFSIHAYYNPRIDKGSRMYHLVRKTIVGYRELVGPENSHKIRPWIQGYGVTEKNMKDQIQAVFDAGACGYTVWSAGNAYGPTYKAMGKMEIPERCR
ncbi:MAG: hypothetical protein Greene041662_282 [Candidatus Peregrinibacteria bacterium Greene0416_62]|nr:MAG: hypothetical protein Greene041662_282 [Candidatus Peregrinibacteria bacterium Greene0416_62]TSC99233.1 MAG: hypothetical protein Greene101449_691 [Candidatus Peregrinibacteria bacterium Greene1014_49]